ncbi:O-antigen ligase family protein [Brumimicrobium mesophilum]|uniref:O-antigen ligase family protein n=1 Tax=Brumimicrobium mesophilum TaxID=392717 RepID=UPI000D1415EF|nr:O-antigen ligase family protein [Brumimicrobium mesophilum]
MLNRFFGPKTHDNINMFAVLVVAIGLPVTKIAMSLGTLLLAINFLLNADFKNYWERTKTNVVFWFVVAVIGFHILGLIYTTDFSFAFRDLNSKLPLFAIPIVMIAYPIKERFLNYIIYGFLLALTITSVVNFNVMMNSDVGGYRDFSLFGSHIRYALLIVTGIVLSVYLILKKNNLRIVFALLGIWFIFYTVVSKVDSGYVALAFLLLGSFIYFIRASKPSGKKKMFGVVVVGISLIVGVQFYEYISPKKAKIDFKTLPTHSKGGEKYFHDTTSIWFENGHHILSNIAENELKEAWNLRSEIDYNDTLSNGYFLNGILFRYMTSKNLTKDKVGMKKMSDEDIKNVENGMTSIRFTYGPLGSKLAGIKDEIYHYSVNGDPDGNSLLQRFEHWKAGRNIIKENWLIGVGTGDLQQEFDAEYADSNTQLDQANWNRAHNQFMTFWIAFGIFGFLVFTGFWLWFLYKNIKTINFIGICFTLIAIGSFLSEDTIETQQGVTFIALFLGIVALMNSWKKEKELNSGSDVLKS